jgi:predicted dehydrogenase
MKNNRRNFLKLSGLAGLGLAGAGFTNGLAPGFEHKKDATKKQPDKTHSQHFNMSGFAAPKLESVRIGFIGLGNRGPEAVGRMSHIEGVEIKALCDIRPERVNTVKSALTGTSHNPSIYTSGEEEWKKLCELPDIDLVYIATPWNMHTSMALYAMNHGKHVCTEVPAAITIDQCWELVETSEHMHKHCMMLENCCYDFFELLTLNMVRQGLFGEIIHGEGAYIHDILKGIFSKDTYYNMWRLKENFRNGNIYPTHGLGPVAQVMNINRGDQMEYLVSTSSKDFMMKAKAKELAASDDFYKPFENQSYRGNRNITTICTAKGRTIMLQHDVTSPNIYSRIFKISGTKASCLKYPAPGKIAFGDEDWLTEKEYKNIEALYAPAIVKKMGEIAKEVGGHGGMDFIMDWRTIDCLHNGLPLDQDVYDAALWSSIAPLSEWSVANRSGSIDVPDFTCGSWKMNEPIDISLERGGNTKVLA